MATSVSSIVKRLINSSPFISEMLIEEVISFSNLAQYLKPKVEELYTGPVTLPSIVMAIRRYAEELKKENHLKEKGRKKIEYELSMKSNIYDVNITFSRTFISKLPQLYSLVRQEAGDFINVSVGEREIVIVVSDKYKNYLDELTKKENITQQEKDMVAVSIFFKDETFLETPGVTYLATRKLAWENINIYEIVSTLKGLTFIIKKEDSIRAYALLQAFLDEEL